MEKNQPYIYTLNYISGYFMDGWNTTFILVWPVFRGELLVPGRVIWITPQQKPNKKPKVSWNMS